MNALPESPPVFDIAPFRARRERLLERMARAGGGIAILPTAPERLRNRDTHHPYRHDSHFYYLSGFREPEAVLVLWRDVKPRQAGPAAAAPAQVG